MEPFRSSGIELVAHDIDDRTITVHSLLAEAGGRLAEVGGVAGIGERRDAEVKAPADVIDNDWALAAIATPVDFSIVPATEVRLRTNP